MRIHAWGPCFCGLGMILHKNHVDSCFSTTAKPHTEKPMISVFPSGGTNRICDLTVVCGESYIKVMWLHEDPCFCAIA